MTLFLLALPTLSPSAFADDLRPDDHVAATVAGHRRPGPRRPPPPPHPAAPAPAPRPDTHAVTLSMSALDAAAGVAGLSAEFRVDRQGGVLVEGAIGSNGSELLYRAGGEARRYVVGDFDTGVYLALGADLGNHHFFTPVVDALAVGPSLGAKFTLPQLPITLQGAVGADLVVAQEYVAVVPAVSVGLGFSF